MTYRTLVLEKKAHIAYVRLCRPQGGNVISRETLEELATAATAINDDEKVYVAILSGEGDIFCLGWDTSNREAEGEALLPWALPSWSREVRER